MSRGLAQTRLFICQPHEPRALPAAWRPRTPEWTTMSARACCSALQTAACACSCARTSWPGASTRWRPRTSSRPSSRLTRHRTCTAWAARGALVRQCGAQGARRENSHPVRALSLLSPGRPGRVTSLVTRASLGLAQRLAASAADRTPIDAAFSRNRSLSRSAKKQALVRAITAVAASVAPANRVSKA